MKAAVYYGPKDVRLEDVEVPKIKDGEALVRVRACGICGTDVKTMLRGHPMIKPPSVLGHEIVGEIIEVKKDIVEHKAGDRVVVAPLNNPES